jgi:lysyl-tRNA synthetase class II
MWRRLRVAPSRHLSPISSAITLQCRLLTGGAPNIVPEINYYENSAGNGTNLLFGDYQSIASESQIKRDYQEIDKISTSHTQGQGDPIWLRGRVQSIRVKGNASFLVLRSNASSTIQVTYFKDKTNAIESKKLLKYLEGLTVESIVDVRGKVVSANVLSCTQSDVEVNLSQIFVVSRAPSVLPFRLEDAAR